MSKKSNRWSMKDVEKLPAWAQAQINTQLAGYDTAKQESDKLQTLELPPQAPRGMVDIPGPLLVRITRVNKRRLDDDNLSGGCKELRDAVAAMLGRKDDSEAGQMNWEYNQETGRPATRLEIFDLKAGNSGQHKSRVMK